MDIISFIKAKKAQQTADFVQAQLNQAIAAGDQLAETQQARVNVDGATFTTLKERIDADVTQLRQRDSEIDLRLSGVTNGSVIQEDDVSKIKALIENNKPVRFAILGDSTKAGVGWRFGGSDTGYGEMGDIDKPSSPEIFFLNLLKGSQYFIKPSEDIGGVEVLSKKGVPTSYVSPTATSTNWDRYVLTFGVANQPASITLRFKHLPQKRNKLCVYYLSRTADPAAQADIISNGVTTIINSYKPSVVYNGVTIPQQGFALEVAEIPIPTTGDTFEITIGNIRARDGSSATQGTINIVGFYYGEPLHFKNLAVRGTTLKDNTSQNAGKGVTTSERLQKAFEYGANVFYLGWGTNDANLAHTTPQEFGNDLRTRIDEIRSIVEGAVIIVDSAYPGTLSGYSNVEHFVEAKKVSLEKKVSFFDIANILLKFPKTEVINDYVHPNEYGYRVAGEAMSYLFGALDSAEVDKKENSKLLVPFSSTGSKIVISDTLPDISGRSEGNYYFKYEEKPTSELPQAESLLIHLDATNRGATDTTWQDLSGKGNDGTLIGFADPASSWSDTSLVFSEAGTNEKVVFSTLTDNLAEATLIVELKQYPTSKDFLGIFGKNSATERQFYFDRRNTGHYRLGLGTTPTFTSVPLPDITDSFHQIALTMKNGVAKVYFDGGLLTTYSYTENILTEPLQIGYAFGSFVGEFSKFFVYNKELTAAEIRQIYHPYKKVITSIEDWLGNVYSFQ